MLFDPTEHLPAKIPEDVMVRIRHLEEIEEQSLTPNPSSMDSGANTQ
jgi:hypothetical protein